MSQKKPDEAGKLPLTPHQRRNLLRSLRTTSDARLYRRVLALVLVDRGQTVCSVAKTLRVGRASVHNWLRRFRLTHDPQGLLDRPGRGRHSIWTDELTDLLEQALAVPPASLGYVANGWTLPLLREHLERLSGQRLSESTLRRQMRARGMRYKRPRYILEPDPEAKKKSAKSCISSLGCRRKPRSGCRMRRCCACFRPCARAGRCAVSRPRCA